MMLHDVNAEARRLPLAEPAVRDALHSGRLTQVTLRGNTPLGFCVEGIYQADSGLPVPAVLVNRSGGLKTIKCPERALAYLRRLGVEEFEVDVRDWDPGQAFNPGQGSYRSRERRRLFLAAQDRVSAYIDVAGLAPDAEAGDVLAALLLVLRGREADELDLRALAMCWCDCHLARFPEPELAQRALLRFARSEGILAVDLEQQLASCCDDEFSRRCKNQHLSTLELGDVG